MEIQKWPDKSWSEIPKERKPIQGRECLVICRQEQSNLPRINTGEFEVIHWKISITGDWDAHLRGFFWDIEDAESFTNSLTQMKNMEEKNCAFQYVKIEGSILPRTTIMVDASELNIDEAKRLWNEHFADCAKWIKEGNTAEMVIWINMQTPQSYGDSLQYISTDADSDGVSIWETKKIFFIKEF